MFLLIYFFSSLMTFSVQFLCAEDCKVTAKEACIPALGLFTPSSLWPLAELPRTVLCCTVLEVVSGLTDSMTLYGEAAGTWVFFL